MTPVLLIRPPGDHEPHQQRRHVVVVADCVETHRWVIVGIQMNVAHITTAHRRVIAGHT